MMQEVKSISKRCLLIKPDSSIQATILVFDSDFSQTNNPTNFQIVQDNIKNKYGCLFYHLNLLNAIFPDHTYYSIFYQSDKETIDKTYNKIASQMTSKKCYGECLVVHFDTFNDLCDIDKNTFIKLYNTKHLNSPIRANNDKIFVVGGNTESGCIMCVVS